jgi:hypothetical protein
LKERKNEMENKSNLLSIPFHQFHFTVTLRRTLAPTKDSVCLYLCLFVPLSVCISVCLSVSLSLSQCKLFFALNDPSLSHVYVLLPMPTIHFVNVSTYICICLHVPTYMYGVNIVENCLFIFFNSLCFLLLTFFLFLSFLLDCSLSLLFSLIFFSSSFLFV